MFLPQADPTRGPDATWWAFDTRETVRQVTLDATGAGTVTLPEVPDTERWQVDRIVVSTSAGSVTTFRLYLGSPDPINLVDGTAAGDFDVNDADAPIEVRPGVVLTGVWAGGEVGAVATMRVHYTVQRQGSA